MGTIVTRKVTLYTTSDGIDFFNKDEAEEHEKVFEFTTEYEKHPLYVEGSSVYENDVITWARANKKVLELLLQIV